MFEFEEFSFEGLSANYFSYKSMLEIYIDCSNYDNELWEIYAEILLFPGTSDFEATVIASCVMQREWFLIENSLDSMDRRYFDESGVLQRK